MKTGVSRRAFVGGAAALAAGAAAGALPGNAHAGPLGGAAPGPRRTETELRTWWLLGRPYTVRAELEADPESNLFRIRAFPEPGYECVCEMSLEAVKNLADHPGVGVGWTEASFRGPKMTAAERLPLAFSVLRGEVVIGVCRASLTPPQVAFPLADLMKVL